MAPKEVYRECEGCFEKVKASEFRLDRPGYLKKICKVCEAEQRKADQLGYGPELRSYEITAWRKGLTGDELLQTLQKHPVARARAELMGYWPVTGEEYRTWRDGSNTPTAKDSAGKSLMASR